MTLASAATLLQAALSLLALVQSTPNIPQSLETTAVQTAQQAISIATADISAMNSTQTVTSNSSLQTPSLSEDTMFTATPTSGADPLTVTFTRGSFAIQYPSNGTPLQTLAESNIQYAVSFGDGTPTETLPVQCSSGTGQSCTADSPTATHTYSTPGTYTAQLLYASRDSIVAACASQADNPDGCSGISSLFQPINSITITVTGNTTPTQASATIDQNTVTATYGSDGYSIPAFTGTATGVSNVSIVVVPTDILASTAFATNGLYYTRPENGEQQVAVEFNNVPVESDRWQSENQLPSGGWGAGSINYGTGQTNAVPTELTVLVYDVSNGLTAALGEAPLVEQNVNVVTQ